VRVDRRELLRSIPIFSSLSDRELDLLLTYTTTKRVKKREFLCRRGDPGHQLFAVMEGRLRVVGQGGEGREVVFNFMDPGDVIGEVSLLDSQPRSASVEAVEDATVLALHRRDLLPFFERNPKAAMKLATVLAERLRRISELVEDTVFLGLPSRLAKKLLALAQRYGKETPKGLLIDLKLPQHELGELVGTSRESINKQLRQWGEEGLVHVERGYVTLADRSRLEDLARLLAG
jgi:CRP/FNR family transcriptional regulator, cyclic AMP receptor protein